MKDEFLEDFILFQDMTSEELREIKKITYLKEYQKNEIIFLEGEAGEAVYIIISGLVKIFKTGRSGREKTLALLGAGNFFGEMALMDGELRSASVESIEDSSLLVIERRKFNDLIIKFPQIALKIIVVLSDRLRKANEQIKDLTFKTVKERLKDILENLAFKYGEKHKQGILITEKITHQELADLTGTTRETITRLLGEMVADDQLLIKNRYLILPKNKLD